MQSNLNDGNNNTGNQEGNNYTQNNNQGENKEGKENSKNQRTAVIGDREGAKRQIDQIKKGEVNEKGKANKENAYNEILESKKEEIRENLKAKQKVLTDNGIEYSDEARELLEKGKFFEDKEFTDIVNSNNKESITDKARKLLMYVRKVFPDTPLSVRKEVEEELIKYYLNNNK